MYINHLCFADLCGWNLLTSVGFVMTGDWAVGAVSGWA